MRTSSFSSRHSVVASSAVAFLLSSTHLFQFTSAQIGIDLCACQPAVYELTLNFSLTCADLDVGGPGIDQDPACFVEPRERGNVTDLVPASVSQIQIIELDQELSIVKQSVYSDDGPYFDGDSVEYTSIVATDPDSINEVRLPLGIQVTISAINSFNEPLVNSWAVIYENDCGFFPLLTEGQRIGWIVFTDLGDPPVEFCPIAATLGTTPPATEAPFVAQPTTPPMTMLPTSAPISQPTAAPVMPSTSPSKYPTITQYPTITPTTAKPSISLDPTLSSDIGLIIDASEPSASPTCPIDYAGKGKGKGKGMGKGRKNGDGSKKQKKEEKTGSGKGKGKKEKKEHESTMKGQMEKISKYDDDYYHEKGSGKYDDDYYYEKGSSGKGKGKGKGKGVIEMWSEYPTTEPSAYPSPSPTECPELVEPEEEEEEEHHHHHRHHHHRHKEQHHHHHGKGGKGGKGHDEDEDDDDDYYMAPAEPPTGKGYGKGKGGRRRVEEGKPGLLR